MFNDQIQNTMKKYLFVCKDESCDGLAVFIDPRYGQVCVSPERCYVDSETELYSLLGSHLTYRLKQSGLSLIPVPSGKVEDLKTLKFIPGTLMSPRFVLEYKAEIRKALGI